MSKFGPLLASLVVEDAADATVRKWMRTELAEVAAQYGLARGQLALPKSYPTASQFGWVEDQLPSIGIHCPGVSGPPVKESGPRGNFRVKWRLEVAALVSASTQINTDRLAKLYAAALWAAIMQHPSLGGVAEDTEWVSDGERYDVLDAGKGRSLAFCLLLFDVTLKDARSSYGGPREPLPAGAGAGEDGAHGDWPAVETVRITVDPLDD